MVVPGTSLIANGSDYFTASVTVRNTAGDPVQGATVTLQASGSGNTIQATILPTDANGVTTATVTSTRAENKTLTVTASTGGTPVTLASMPMVTFTPGAAAALEWAMEPSSVQAGATFNVAVNLVDANGNQLTTGNQQVSLSLMGGTSGAVLAGTTSVNAVNGRATFNGLSVIRAGTGYQLVATMTGAMVTSTAFDISAAGPAQLAFLPQPPAVVTIVTEIDPPVGVAVQDTFGNTVTSATTAITLELLNGGSAMLSGTLTANAVAGVATFPGLSLTATGTGMQLRASGGGLASADSSTFEVVDFGVATRWRVTLTPSSTIAAGVTFSALVEAVDSTGMKDSSFTGDATLALVTPGTGTLLGTTSVVVAMGEGMSTDLAVQVAGSGNVVRATGGNGTRNLVQGDSAAFTVTPGAATALVYTTQPPSSPVAGQTFDVVLTARDTFGNTATGFAEQVSLALQPATGLLQNASPLTPTAGVATFAAVHVQKTGTYTLHAATTTFSDVASNAFTVSHGPASKVVFTTAPPATEVAGTPFPVAVEVLDALDNRATTYGANIVAGIQSGPSGGVLAGSTTVAATAGTASYTLSLNRSGSYVLAFSSGTLTSAVSASVDITVGTPAQLAFIQQPTNANYNAVITPPITVVAQDDQGNTATTYATDVTLEWAVPSTAPAGTTGTFTQMPSSGIAAFGDIMVGTGGSGYQLRAVSGTLTTATSTTFAIAGPNTAPVLTVPGAQNTNEDTLLSITGISVADADAAAGSLAVTVGADVGTVSVTVTTGLTGLTGQNTGSLAFAGTLTAINNALGSLRYQPPLNASGAALITVNVDDQGNTGVGGPLADSDTIAVSIAPVDDAPVITGLGGDTVAFTENGPFLELDQGGNVAVSDVEDTDFTGYVLTATLTNPAASDEFDPQDSNGLAFNGTTFDVTASAVSIGSYTDNGNQVTVTFTTSTAANVAHVIRAIRFRNTSDSPVTTARTVTFQLAKGALNSGNQSVTITVAAVDDPAAIGNLHLDNPSDALTPVLLDVGGNATFTDPDSTVFANPTIVVSYPNTDGTANDQLDVSTAGPFSRSGNSITLDAGGAQVATVGGGANNGSNGNRMSLTLAANITAGQIQDLLRALTYDNAVASRGVASSRQLLVSVTVNGQVSTATINVTLPVQ